MTTSRRLWRDIRPTAPVYVLGGYQTDFARNWGREGLGLFDLCREATLGVLDAADVDAAQIDVGHVGNFAGELFCGQGHLGGLLVETHPDLVGMPTGRHEAACASGSIATLAAMADLESGRYDLALVLGVEQMRNLSASATGQALGSAAWVPRETEGIDFPFPQLFSELGDEYDRRYGLDPRHLAQLARWNLDHARHNPRAQTRTWRFDDDSFAPDDTTNPPVAGRIRRQDCSQITDGAAALVLASAPAAAAWARAHGQDLDRVPRITGWGHRTSRMALADKLAASAEDDHVIPFVRASITDALERAGTGVTARAGAGGPEPGPATVDVLDAIETHDCFTTTHYLAIDHFGITPPGASWQAIEDGRVGPDGACPMNPSGGLIGGGHPVGATGVRMLVDAAHQVAGTAGATQVEAILAKLPGTPRRVATLNMGGSATTSVSFVIEA